MGTTSTFGTFTMARLGIYVAQHSLNVTGNNISNINTKGYSRQQLDQSSMYYGSADRYQSRYDIRENGGVMAQGVNQLRDKYLDIRYRNEETRVGEATAKLSGLTQLGDIFDEVAKGEDGDGVLEARFNDLIQQIENLHKPENAGKDDMDSIVRSAAEALTTQFHDYAKQLETLKLNMTAQFRQEVDSVNATLTKIRDLNESIRRTQVFGGSALTRQDERNLLIDELSQQIGIHVTYEMEDLGDGVSVEKLKITTSGDPSRTLIDGIYGTQLTILNENNYDLSLSELKDANGKRMPNQPNKTERVLSGLEVTSDEQKATAFKTEDYIEEAKSLLSPADAADDAKVNQKAKELAQQAAEDMAKLLSGDTKYTLGDDGKNYYFDVDTSHSADGVYRLHRHEVGKQDAGVSVQLIYSRQAKLSDTELSGGLQAMREIMTEAGEYTDADDPKLNDENDPDYDPLHYDADAASKRGIPYYQKALDTLANTFARVMNEANTLYGSSYVDSLPEKTLYQTDSDGDFVDKDGHKITDPTTQKKVLKDEYANCFKKNADGKYVDKNGAETDDPEKFVSTDAYHDLKTLYETDEEGRFIGSDGKPLSDAQLGNEENYVLKSEYKKYFETEWVDVNGVQQEQFKRDKNGYLIPKEEYQDYMGSPLFSNSSVKNTIGTSGAEEDPPITAANISVAADWESGAHRMLRSKSADAETQSTQQENLGHMITLLTSKHKFTTETGSDGAMYFEGTFQEMLTDTIAGTLAKDTNITQTMLNNYNTTADELYVDRDAVMGVDLNDEAMNMMQYQKAYSAACRLMTTFDGMLEKLINGTAI